jgi:hypothetical protein
VPAGDGSQPFAILGRRTGCVATFDLNKDYLKSIAPFHFIARSAMRFPYCDQINDTARLLPSRTGETDKVPSRKRCAGQCLPNGYLCHCNRPTLRPSCKNKAFLVVSFSHRTNHTISALPPKADMVENGADDFDEGNIGTIVLSRDPMKK